VPDSSPFLPPAAQGYTQQDLLDMLERILPMHYLQPLKDPGPGYELYQAAAKVGERLSLAVQRFSGDAYILSSSGGVKATGSVVLYRDAPSVEGIPVVVKAGTTFRASKSGRLFVATADVTFAPAALGPLNIPVAALYEGYNYNEPGVVLTPDGTSLEGEIDTIVTLVEDPPMGDITIRARQESEVTGGLSPALDQQGADRGIYRGVGELDASYRGRIRALPDNISPNAVDRALQQLLLPFGISYDFIETFDVRYQTCWDAPPDSIAGSQYDPNLFCYDDPRSPVPFRNRWLDESEHRGAFIVAVPAYGPVSDVGLAYDDTAMNAADLANPLGNRAVCAYDAPASVESFGYRLGCFDGYDVGRATTMKALYDTLQNIKAAGIAAVVELEGN